MDDSQIHEFDLTKSFMNNDDSTLHQSSQQAMSHNNSRVNLMNKTPSNSAMPKLKGAANPTESIIAK